MIIAFTPNGWDDYSYWQQNDQQILAKVNELIKEICRDPFRGIGKPEPLRGSFAGFWSRRINAEHRLVYNVSGTKSDQTITIIQVRFHY
jgi:toxin YoeB